MSLPELSIRRPVTIAMVCLALGLVGAISLTRLPIELYPNFSFGDISIIIDIRGGMPPEEVEQRVTKPVEETVGDASHLKDVISISEEGRSRVVLTFEPGTNMDFAALEVREKFSKVRSKLPKEIEKPVIAKFEQEDVPVLIVAVTALEYTPEVLRRMVDDIIKDQIMRVEGVANVDVGGGRERKILVEVDLEKLQAFRLPIDRVTRLLNVSNLNLLAGEVNRTRTKYLIRAIGEFASLEEIENLGISVTPSRSIVRLKDVATVKDSFLEATSIARVDALPVVQLYIQKESTANTVEVVRKVMAALEKLKEDPRLPKVLRYIVTHDQSVHIKRAINMVGSALVSGGVLAMLVLGAFLATHWHARLLCLSLIAAVTLIDVLAYHFAVIPVGVVNWIMAALLMVLLGTAVFWKHLRLTLICALAIPIAAIVTFGFMFFLNLLAKPMGFMSLTLNIMTLGGLAMGVGMLVDNAIVVLDQILKHRASGEGPRRAAGRGARDMMLAILASTVSTVVVFLPIVFISKEIRILYVGFALTICFSLLASLIVALSVVPLLASRLPAVPGLILAPPAGGRARARAAVLYRRALSFALRWRWVVAAVAFFLGAAGWQVFQTIPKEFIGAAEAEDFTVFVELPSGAKLEVSDEAVAKIEKILNDVPEKKTVSSRIEKWSSKVYVKLVPLAERSRSTKDIIDSLRPQVEEVEKGFKEAFIYFEEPQETESNEIILEIYGWDYETLNQIAVEMLKKMQTVPGLTDLKIRWRRGRPEWLIKVDKVKAARFGLTVDDVAQALHAKMRGLRATLYHAEAKEVEVITRLEEADRATLDKLRRITFALPNREVVSLEQVARLEPAIGASKIWRKNKQRMIQVSANRGRYAFGEAAKRIYDAIQDLPLPEDYYWRFGPNYWKLIQNQREMAFALMLSLILIFLVLASLFESFWQPFLILMEVPLGCFGAFLALKLTGQAVNVGALMGLILLGGVVVNNAIILVDEINRLRAGGSRVRRAILQAAQSRLRPIAMSSSTSVLGLLPLALSRAEESALWAPMALVTIGGLALSTLLTPTVIPCLYLVFVDVGGFIRNRLITVSGALRRPHPSQSVAGPQP